MFCPVVCFIGSTNAGKSLFGFLAAAALETKFYDSDDKLVQMINANINLVFGLVGCLQFRLWEFQMFSTFQTMELNATGGGLICTTQNLSRCKMNAVLNVANLFNYKSAHASETTKPIHLGLRYYNERIAVYRQLATPTCCFHGPTDLCCVTQPDQT